MSPLSEIQRSLLRKGPPETLTISKYAAPAEPSSEPTLSALKKSIAKRKLSPKQPPIQGLTEKSPIQPSAKKAKKTTPSVPSPRLAQLLQRSVVQGKIVEVQYFEEQDLGVFLEKIKSTRLIGALCKHPTGVFYSRIG